MIDIEYDGSAWHLTDKQTAKDIERNNKIINEYGLKVLRIKSGENVPSKEQIQNAIDILINTEETYTEIILNDWQDYKNKYIS